MTKCSRSAFDRAAAAEHRQGGSKKKFVLITVPRDFGVRLDWRNLVSRLTSSNVKCCSQPPYGLMSYRVEHFLKFPKADENILRHFSSQTGDVGTRRNSRVCLGHPEPKILPVREGPYSINKPTPHAEFRPQHARGSFLEVVCFFEQCDLTGVWPCSSRKMGKAECSIEGSSYCTHNEIWVNSSGGAVALVTRGVHPFLSFIIQAFSHRWTFSVPRSFQHILINLSRAPKYLPGRL